MITFHFQKRDLWRMANSVTYWQTKNKSIQNETKEHLVAQKGSYYQTYSLNPRKRSKVFSG